MQSGGLISKDNNSSIVYSTNPDFDKDQEQEMDMDPDGKQDLRIHLIRKGGGKIVTVIRGYKGSKEDLDIALNAFEKGGKSAGII